MVLLLMNTTPADPLTMRHMYGRQLYITMTTIVKQKTISPQTIGIIPIFFTTLVFCRESSFTEIHSRLFEHNNVSSRYNNALSNYKVLPVLYKVFLDLSKCFLHLKTVIQT